MRPVPVVVASALIAGACASGGAGSVDRPPQASTSTTVYDYPD